MTSKNDSNNVIKYGYIYDWETAKNVCPSGWHLPSDTEWTALIDNLGGKDVAGGKLKATIYWQSPNEGATNSSGFSALPAGFRISDFGSCGNLGMSAVFWSNTPVGNKTWIRQLDCKFGSGIRSQPFKSFHGFCYSPHLSLRCTGSIYFI